MIKYIQLFKHKNQDLLFYILMPVGFSISLLFFRIAYTGSLYYAFLLWNLFLAFLPFIISTVMSNKKRRKWYHFVLPGIFWLLLLPNAPYIITDFIHLEESNAVPLWFDLILILCFSWNGLMLWLISMFQFNFILKNQFKQPQLHLLNQLIILLSALGIYIGRFGRWNSWDFFINPLDIIGRIWFMIFHPASFPGFYGMTIALYIFLAMLFSFFRRISEPAKVLCLINFFEGPGN